MQCICVDCAEIRTCSKHWTGLVLVLCGRPMGSSLTVTSMRLNSPSSNRWQQYQPHRLSDCQEIEQMSGKCQGFQWKSVKYQGIVREKILSLVINPESRGATWTFLINMKQQLLTIALNSILMNLCLPYCKSLGKVREFHVVWKVVTVDWLIFCVQN